MFISAHSNGPSPFAPARQAGRIAAFTVIELLVVVAIMALLITLMLPALTNSREEAQLTVCQSNLRQVATTTVGYQQDHAGQFLEFFWYAWAGPNIRIMIKPPFAITDGWGYYNPATLVCPNDLTPGLISVVGVAKPLPISYAFNLDMAVNAPTLWKLKQYGTALSFYEGTSNDRTPGAGDPDGGKFQGAFHGTDDFVTQAFRPRHNLAGGMGSITFADCHMATTPTLTANMVLMSKTQR